MVLSSQYTFRIIQYFTDRNNPINLRFNAEFDITPTNFILRIIGDMTREGLMSIYKLNITQYCANETEVLPFIIECEGLLDIYSNNPLSILFNQIRINLLNNYIE